MHWRLLIRQRRDRIVFYHHKNMKKWLKVIKIDKASNKTGVAGMT